MKAIVICADDYGMNPEISAGILALAEQGKISAISCMVTTEHWIEWGEKLRPLIGKVDIGIHLNLTYGDAIDHVPGVTKAGSFGSISALLGKAALGIISADAVIVELSRQLNRFERILGCQPNFIDGHQHVHQLSGVREAVLELYQREQLFEDQVYCRSIYHMDSVDPAYKKKVKILKWAGAKPWLKLLEKYQIPHNPDFTGIYEFEVDPKLYVQQMKRWLSGLEPGGILMCHPGHNSDDDTDDIRQARYMEFQFFMSDLYQKMLDKLQVQVKRFVDC